MEKFPGNQGVYIAIHRADGGVSVMNFLTRARLDPNVDFAGWQPVESWFEREVTPENIESEIAELVKEQGLQHVSWRLMADEESETYINADRTFRSAWKHDFTVDMEKAREIHKRHLRAARRPLLDELDLEVWRAGPGDTAKWLEVESRKQVLRDITDDPRIAAAMTPEQLKSVTVESINAEPEGEAAIETKAGSDGNKT